MKFETSDQALHYCDKLKACQGVARESENFVAVEQISKDKCELKSSSTYSRVRVIYVRVIYDGTGNFQTFWRKPILTQIRVIYNFLGTGNFETEIF